MKCAVVLLSGGIDSATTAAVVKAEGFEIYAMSFDYGQRHRRELESAKMVAKAFEVKKHLIIKFDLREIGGSALTSDIAVPKSQIPSRISRDKSQIPITYVPARNTIFLSFALAFAETIGAEDIFIGANAIDYSGYPDCRPEFISAFENMANLATKAGVKGKSCFKINAPLVNLTKAEIIKKGIGLGVDYSLTWSCYDPQKRSAEAQKCRSAEEQKFLNVTSELPNFRALYVPCNRCDSCVLRAKGFKEAGIEDPLISKIKSKTG